MAKYPKCNRSRGVETGENGSKENSNALPGNSGEPATTSPHDISQIKCDTSSSPAQAGRSWPNAASSRAANQNGTAAIRCRITPTKAIRRRFVHFESGAIATSPTPDLPYRKLSHPFRENMTSPTSDTGWIVRRVGGGGGKENK